MQFAMYLPEKIPPYGVLVREKVMTVVLPLCPVSHVMGVHHCKGPSQPDQCAKINQTIFNPFRAVECLMYQFAVHAKRMTKAESDRTK